MMETLIYNDTKYIKASDYNEMVFCYEKRLEQKAYDDEGEVIYKAYCILKEMAEDHNICIKCGGKYKNEFGQYCPCQRDD